MTAHPNRSRMNRNAKANPTPAEIRSAREAAGLTQTQAAALLYSNLRTWQNWENDDPLEGRKCPPGMFELFLIKTGQKQVYADAPAGIYEVQIIDEGDSFTYRVIEVANGVLIATCPRKENADFIAAALNRLVAP